MCNIRFGNEFENDFGEITFEGIQGSYLPYCDHNTIDFVYKGKSFFSLRRFGRGISVFNEKHCEECEEYKYRCVDEK